MIKRIIFWFFGVLLTLILLAGIYFFFFMYKPPLISAKDLATTNLMPLPAKMKMKNSVFEASEIVFRLNKNCGELVKISAARIGETWPVAEKGEKIEIDVEETSEGIRKPLEDESYSLEVSSQKIQIKAKTEYGAVWALETLAQLAQVEGGEIKVPACKISDSPRYSWRGIMVDVCRHWIPKDVVLRIIDGMSAVKMNVLHLHLSEYQAFRIESKTYTKLQQLGSDGNYFTQDEIKEIVDYAKDRGIRVVPEFDLPGHSTSWFVGYPELAAMPGPYCTDTIFGVLNPVFDPTNEDVYFFLDNFFKDMSRIFPDEYIHIGGDEVNTHDWEANPRIKKFMEDKDFADFEELQAYFNRRLQSILEKYGKKMIGWDEILNPALDTTIVVQSWRSQKSLWEAVKNNGKAILSAGWYLDHKLPAGKHYSVDPEVLPNAVTIEPDTTNWRMYDVELKMGESNIPLQLTFYGDDTNMRGFVSLMGSLMAFENVSKNEDEYSCKINSDYGELTCIFRFEGEKLSGSFGLGVIKMAISGEKIGGNDIAGTVPPKVEKTVPLTETEKARILGGEACIWAEVVTAQNIESRIWPRTAAIAEKLWSPASLTKDVDNMYRRLKLMDNYLVENGAAYKTNQIKMVQKMAGDNDISALMNLVDVLEEVKFYNRLSSFSNLTVNTPLEGLADAAMPESFTALEFNKMVDEFLADSLKEKNYLVLESMLNNWITNYEAVEQLLQAGNQREGLESLSAKLKQAAQCGVKMLKAARAKENFGDEEKARITEILNFAQEPEAGAEIAVIGGIRKLLQ